MKDEGFLSPVGKRFIMIAAVLLLGGVIAYYALSEEISFDFLEDLGQEETSTTSTTFDIPEVEIPETEIPEIEIPGGPGAPPQSAQDSIREAQEFFECVERAQGDVNEISACANQTS